METFVYVIKEYLQEYTPICWSLSRRWDSEGTLNFNTCVLIIFYIQHKCLYNQKSYLFWKTKD